VPILRELKFSPRRHLTLDQRACADALRNQILDSYRAMREEAKARQAATFPTKGQKGFHHNVGVFLRPHRTRSRSGWTFEVRAKAAGTNANYIAIAESHSAPAGSVLCCNADFIQRFAVFG